MQRFWNSLFANFRVFFTAGIVNAWEGEESDAAKIIAERTGLRLELDPLEVDEPPAIEALRLDELVIE